MLAPTPFALTSTPPCEAGRWEGRAACWEGVRHDACQVRDSCPAWGATVRRLQLAACHHHTPPTHSWLAAAAALPCLPAAVRTSQLMRLPRSWGWASRWRHSQPSELLGWQRPEALLAAGLGLGLGLGLSNHEPPAHLATACALPLNWPVLQGHGRHRAVPGRAGGAAGRDAPLARRPRPLPGRPPAAGGQAGPAGGRPAVGFEHRPTEGLVLTLPLHTQPRPSALTLPSRPPPCLPDLSWHPRAGGGAQGRWQGGVSGQRRLPHRHRAHRRGGVAGQTCKWCFWAAAGGVGCCCVLPLDTADAAASAWAAPQPHQPFLCRHAQTLSCALDRLHTQMLGIPVGHVFANNILFDVSPGREPGQRWRGLAAGAAAPNPTAPPDLTSPPPPPTPPPPLVPSYSYSSFLQHDGAYDGFDPAEFTSRSGGKAEAVKHIKAVSKVGRGAGLVDGSPCTACRYPPIQLTCRHPPALPCTPSRTPCPAGARLQHSGHGGRRHDGFRGARARRRRRFHRVRTPLAGPGASWARGAGFSWRHASHARSSLTCASG